jgi:hypothetical protein
MSEKQKSPEQLAVDQTMAIYQRVRATSCGLSKEVSATLTVAASNLLLAEELKRLRTPKEGNTQFFFGPSSE